MPEIHVQMPPSATRVFEHVRTLEFEVWWNESIRAMRLEIWRDLCPLESHVELGVAPFEGRVYLRRSAGKDPEGGTWSELDDFGRIGARSEQDATDRFLAALRTRAATTEGLESRAAFLLQQERERKGWPEV